LTIVAGIRFLATMTFLYCCTPEHAYRAIAWQQFGQIRYNTLAFFLFPSIDVIKEWVGDFDNGR
jgi:hypothetical protein